MARPTVTASTRAHSVPPSLHLPTALGVLRLVAAGGCLSMSSLAEAAGVSRATLYRVLAALEAHLGVRVELGSDGPRVTDWGGLRRAWVLG